MALLQIDFYSDVLGMNMPMNVVLPQRTQGGIGVDVGEIAKTFPTLYLLHGLTDDHTTWARRSPIELFAELSGIAVVMPTTHRAWYTNEAHGMKYRTFIGEELPKVCRSFFNGMSDRREDNYIAGVSMGGYGALALALTYPESYSLCMPLSGSFDTKWLKGDNPDDTYFDDVFGPIGDFDGSANDVFKMAEDVKRSGALTPKIWMWCGHDDFLIDCNRRMSSHLSALGYDVTYSETDGSHGWVHWNRHIEEMFAVIAAHRAAMEDEGGKNTEN